MERVLWISSECSADTEQFLESLSRQGILSSSRVADTGEALQVLLPDGKNGEKSPFSLVSMSIGTTRDVENIRRLRSEGVTIPIFAFSAIQIESESDLFVRMVVEALRAGADDCQPVPFNFDEWRERFRALIRRGPETVPMEIDYGAMCIYPESLNTTLVVGGKGVHLTGTENAVVRIFARKVGEVVSKEKISDNLHSDPADEPDTQNFLRSLVSRIRKKMSRALGITASQTPIENVRGRGFRLLRPEDWQLPLVRK